MNRAEKRLQLEAGAFVATLENYELLLRGRFHRWDDDASTTPLTAAFNEIVRRSRGKVVPVPETEGESLEERVRRLAHAHKMRARRIRLDAGDRPEGGGPILAFDTGGTPIVLVPRAAGGFDRLLPGSAARRRARDWCEFAPDAYVLHPTLADDVRGFARLMGFGLTGCAPDLAVLSVCGLLGAGLALLLPIAAEHIAEIGVHNRDMEFLAGITLALLGATAVEAITHFVGSMARLRIRGRAGAALHAAMLDRLLRLVPSAYASTTTLILATQTETVEKFRGALLNIAAAAVFALMNGLAAAFLIASVAPLAGLAVAGLCLVSLVVAAFLGWAQFKAIYEGERMDVIVLAFVFDLVRLIPPVRAARAEKRVFTRWSQNFLAFQSRLMRSGRIAARFPVFEAVWDALAMIVCFAAVASAGAGEAAAAGGAVTVVMAFGRLTGACKRLSHDILSAAKLLPMAKLARPLLEYPTLPLRAERASIPLSGGIEARGVSHHYGDRRVLDHIDLMIDAGEFIGIVGASGAGKSTFARLLLGLERPTEGRFLLDDRDATELDRGSITRGIGFVTRNSQPLPGTILDNIRGARDVSEDEVWECAAAAGVADELRALPMGLRTVIGEGGAGFARGQIQRVLIARALAGRPAVLVLDEALSAIDDERAIEILAAAARFTRTRVVVTHRPASLRGADRTFVMDRGRLFVADPTRPTGGGRGER